jgi:hypothetical protein
MSGQKLQFEKQPSIAAGLIRSDYAKPGEREGLLNSYLLAGFVLVMFLSLTAGAWLMRGRLSRQFGFSLGVCRWIAMGIAMAGIAATVFVFYSDDRMRTTTLYEEILPGTLDEPTLNGEPFRQRSFTVEHPGIPHTLFISPIIGSGIDAQFEVDVSFSLKNPQGQPLLNIAHRFKPGRQRSRMVEIRDWEGMQWLFTPETPGVYTLTMKLQTMRVPALHVRISDPAKRDGMRPPGY